MKKIFIIPLLLLSLTACGNESSNNSLKRNLTNDLSIVHRRNEFRAQKIKVDYLKQFNCKYYLNKSSTVITKNQLEIIDNETKSKEIISFDYLIVQYGHFDQVLFQL